MKKRMLLAGVASLALTVVSSQANLSVAWSANHGFYLDVGDGPLLGSAGSGQATLAQLIWSPDNIPDPATDDAANHYLSSSGNDVWLVDFTVKEGDTARSEWGDWGLNDSPLATSTTLSDGYIYGRIFQDGTPDVGDWYYLGPVVANENVDPNGVPPPTPQTYDMNRDSEQGYGDAVMNGPYSYQVVPEPGTFALFGIGALLIGLRRRK